MTLNKKHSYCLTILISSLAPIIWGSSYIVTTELLPKDRPLIAAFLRCLPAGIFLILLSRTLPKKEEWKTLIILSLLNFTVFQALLFFAAYRLPGGLAAVLGATQPLIIMLLSWKMDSHKPVILSLFSALIAILAMAVLFITPDATWALPGALAALLAASSMATGSFLAKRWRNELPLLAFTGWQLLIGALFLAPFAYAFEAPLETLSTREILGYLYLSLFGTVIAYLLWFQALSKLASLAVTSLGLLSPISAVILGWLLLDQRLSSTSIIALIIALLSILVLQFSSQKPLQIKEDKLVKNIRRNT